MMRPGARGARGEQRRWNRILSGNVRNKKGRLAPPFLETAYTVSTRFTDHR